MKSDDYARIKEKEKNQETQTRVCVCVVFCYLSPLYDIRLYNLTRKSLVFIIRIGRYQNRIS